MEMMTQCTECMGSGTILGTECGHCDGSRKILIDEVYEAHIPPGWNPKNLVKTDHPECMIRVVHELPDHIQIIGKDIVMTEFVTIRMYWRILVRFICTMTGTSRFDVIRP
jgi:hypothetical protein